jgi:hypothetical protein
VRLACARFPKNLEPNAIETFRLFSGEEIQIPKATPCFEKWSGETLADTYGNKTLLNFDGEPVFAELAILRIFQNDGWSGVWVDTYRRKYRTEDWNNENGVDLPPDKRAFLDNIYKTQARPKAVGMSFAGERNRLYLQSQSVSRKTKSERRKLIG